MKRTAAAVCGAAVLAAGMTGCGAGFEGSGSKDAASAEQLATVSYTHLDVYKRQVGKLLRNNNMAAKMGRYIWNTNGKRGLSDFLSHKGRTETTARIVPMLSAYMLPKTAILRTCLLYTSHPVPTVTDNSLLSLRRLVMS